MPALIFSVRNGGGPKPIELITSCVSQGLVTDEAVRRLLGTFITGNAADVMAPLLPLMDTVASDTVRWVPYHMTNVLSTFAEDGSALSEPVKAILLNIVNQLTGFKEAKCLSGDAWERLFVAVLLIRSLSRQVDESILPLGGDYSNCSVSFNAPFDLMGKTYEAFTEAAEFAKGIVAPEHFPHIAVYFPPNAQFKDVDVIVACWKDARSPTLYGYQLKEGKQLPDRAAPSVLAKTFVIRGKAAGSPRASSATRAGWTIPSATEIDAFFGVSGLHWTPAKWAELEQTESKQ